MSAKQRKGEALSKKFRIDGFSQMKFFWEIVIDGEITIGLAPSHIAVYSFLFNQGNSLRWINWISLPRESIMHGARIKDKKTFYKIIHDLETFGFIQIRKGVANKIAAQYKIIKLSIPFNPPNLPSNPTTN